MKILVTGANGFVGSSLCRRLLAESITVHAATRSPLKTPSNHLLFNSYTTGNIDEYTNWQSALDGVDVVIHLAARVHMMQDNAVDPLSEFIKINCDATLNLAKQAAATGVRRFIFLSSIKVNGETTEGRMPFKETDEPNPQDPYGISKLHAEEALKKVSHDTGMELVIVRPPLVFGPGVRANFLKLLQLADRGIPLPLGQVKNQRSLIFVENLSDALLRCATQPAAAGKTYLVSDGQSFSTAELFQSISYALERRGRLLSIPVNLMRIVALLFGKTAVLDRLTQSLIVDSQKISKELNWIPPYTLNEGLKITADWYRSEHPA